MPTRMKEKDVAMTEFIKRSMTVDVKKFKNLDSTFYMPIGMDKLEKDIVKRKDVLRKMHWMRNQIKMDIERTKRLEDMSLLGLAEMSGKYHGLILEHVIRI